MKTPQVIQHPDPSFREHSRLGLWRSIRSKFARRDESGQMLILFALMLPALVMMLALTADLGMAYAERRQTQNVADSGAQAGTAVIKRHRISGNASGMDAEVQVAIQDIASRASGGLGSFTLGSCSGATTTPKIHGEYIDWYGTAVGQIGGGDNTNAYGVRLTPCKDAPTYFAKVINVNTIRVSTTAAWVYSVVNGINPDSPAFGPFAVWYGDTLKKDFDQYGQPNCGLGDPYCVRSGQTVVFRDNNYCDDPNVSSGAARAPGGDMACDSNNFKGDINHGQGWVNIGVDNTSNGGNALGQYKNTLAAHQSSGDPMLFPLITLIDGGGTGIKITVQGFTCVRVKELGGGGSASYKAEILAVANADFNTAANIDNGCQALLNGASAGPGTVTPTSILVDKALQ